MAKHFTLEEANELVPWLKEVLGEAKTLRESRAAVQQEIAQIAWRVKSNGGDKVGIASESLRQEAGQLQERLDKIAEEVSGAGVILRDMDTGLVDFPHLRNERQVYLCWRLGEEKVAFWHETNAGFLGRQPL